MHHECSFIYFVSIRNTFSFTSTLDIELTFEQEELKPREEKKIKYDIEDLEKEELNLEESYCKKRMELVKARHNLRK